MEWNKMEQNPWNFQGVNHEMDHRWSRDRIGYSSYRSEERLKLTKF